MRGNSSRDVLETGVLTICVAGPAVAAALIVAAHGLFFAGRVVNSGIETVQRIAFCADLSNASTRKWVYENCR